MPVHLREYFRTLCVFLFVLLAVVDARTAFAQSYPAKPIKIIVPVAAGGGTDFSARLIAQNSLSPGVFPLLWK